MTKILMAIGCDAYERLSLLHGAVNDARSIFEALTVPQGDYDRERSILLESPNLARIHEALRQLGSEARGADVVTVFFAGHGGTKAGNYYLCPVDADIDSMSTTALSLAQLLAVLVEARPAQANIVIDSCESGAGMWDAVSILRSDVLAGAGSSGVSFFAACGPHEYAGEDARGGFATSELLDYIRGVKELQRTRPYLDLVDLGRRVSSTLSTKTSDQVPVTWGLNLYGEGRFAPNPFFANVEAGAPSVPVIGIAFDSPARAIIGRHSEALWTQRRQISQEPDTHAVVRRLSKICEELDANAQNPTAFLRGIVGSYAAVAGESPDMFAELEIIAAVTSVLLNWIRADGAKDLLSDLLDRYVNASNEALQNIEATLDDQKYTLISSNSILADLFYLPLRLSRILGWLAAGSLIDRLRETSSFDVPRLVRVMRKLSEQYGGSFVAVSDEQMVPTYLADLAMRQSGLASEREEFLGYYFASLLDTKVRIAAPYVDGRAAFDYSYALATGGQPERAILAAPSQFLAILLLLGENAALSDEWDLEFQNLDRITSNWFVPNDFLDFGKTQINAGHNVSFEIGLGVWNLADCAKLFRDEMVPRITDAARTLDRESACAAILASLAMPERLPLFLELRDFGG